MPGDKYAQHRAEFISGTMTVRELAEQKGESYDAMRKVAERQGWHLMRQEHAQNVAEMSQKAMAHAAGRAMAKLIGTYHEQNAGDLKIARAIRARVAARLKAMDSGENISGQELMSLAGAAQRAQAMWRAALGVKTSLSSSPDGNEQV